MIFADCGTLYGKRDFADMIKLSLLRCGDCLQISDGPSRSTSPEEGRQTVQSQREAAGATRLALRVGLGPWAQEKGAPLDATKDKETDSPLGPAEFLILDLEYEPLETGAR